MKKIICFVLASIFMLAFSVSALADPVIGIIDDYEIEIGEPIYFSVGVAVPIKYTNNSQETIAPSKSILITIYQNGIECYNEVYSLEGLYDNNNNKFIKVRPGKTYEFYYGVTLRDTTDLSELEIEITSKLKNNHDIIHKDISKVD